MMSRKVFTYKDTKEAEAYIGKKGIFSDSLEEVETGVGFPGLLRSIEPDEYHFKGANGVYWQFFSPDPVETWVPFTARDSHLFAGKFVRDAVSWENQLGGMIVAYHLKGAHIVAPGTGAIREIEYSELWARFVFLDGTPCGKKVTQ